MAGEIANETSTRIGGSEQFKTWLDRANPSLEIRLALAVRAVLRALPFVNPGQSTDSQKSTHQLAGLVGGAFRATAIARIAAKYPSRQDELRGAASHTVFALAETAQAAGGDEVVRASALVVDALAGDQRAADAPALAIAAAASAVATHSRASAAIKSRLATLTRRENQILASLLRGESAKVIAHDLGLSIRTAEVHRANIMAKMRAGNLAELVKAALTAGASDGGEDSAAYWEALSADLRAIEGGATSRALADRPLWPGEPPQAIADLWRDLSARLPLGDGWRVWTRWYDARLKGVAGWSEARELIYATVPAEVWNEGPAAANAWIAERLEELDSKGSDQADPPSSAVAIPMAKPATVEPVIRDGKIVLPADAVQPELDAQAFEEALKALRSLIADLADDLDGEANIDKRAIALLRRIAERIPDSVPSQAQLFGLAHQQETLEDYGRKVIAEWPDLLASRYLGVVRAFDGTIRQFSNWRAFKQNALKDRLTEEQRAKAPVLGKRFAEALRDAANAKHVDPAIAAVIEAIAEDLKRATDDSLPRERTAHGADTRPEDLVTSVENTIKRIGDAAVQADVEKKAEATYGAKVLRGAASQIFQGEKLGENIGKWATNIFLAAGAGYAGTHTAELSAVITDLMQQFPNYTHWLQPLIDHLKR